MDKGQRAAERNGKTSRASKTQEERKKEIKRNNKILNEYLKLKNKKDTDELCDGKEKEDKQRANNKNVFDKNHLYLKIQEIVARPPSINTTFNNG